MRESDSFSADVLKEKDLKWFSKRLLAIWNVCRLGTHNSIIQRKTNVNNLKNPDVILLAD